VHERWFPYGFLGVLADNRDGLSGRNVKARAPVRFVGNAVEIFLDNFVTVEAGSGESAQFQVFDPSGNYGEDGGGAEFMLNTIQGTPPSTAP